MACAIRRGSRGGSKASSSKQNTGRRAATNSTSLRGGANYGWPKITYGRNYNGTEITRDKAREGMEQPLAYWVPSFGPSGLAIYSSDRFPEWRGNVFLGALAGIHLRRLILEGTRVVEQQQLLLDRRERIRDVRQGPDGYLYVLTDSEAGELLRVSPE